MLFVVVFGRLGQDVLSLFFVLKSYVVDCDDRIILRRRTLLGMDGLKHHSLFYVCVSFCSQDGLIYSYLFVKRVLFLNCFDGLLHQLLKLLTIVVVLFFKYACLHG